MRCVPFCLVIKSDQPRQLPSQRIIVRANANGSRTPPIRFRVQPEHLHGREARGSACGGVVFTKGPLTSLGMDSGLSDITDRSHH